MIEEVNKLSGPPPSGPDGSEDPIGQLSAILGAHLRALSSIDGNTGKLEQKVQELEEKMGAGSRQQGRRGVNGAGRR